MPHIGLKLALRNRSGDGKSSTFPPPSDFLAKASDYTNYKCSIPNQLALTIYFLYYPDQKFSVGINL